jgi:pSer/pThr/pTyr-binding forkhead associated (FHA) protein
MFRLELRFQNLTIREYILVSDDVRIIGRDPASHIVIDDPEISRKHAYIRQIGNRLFVWDEGSKHGTIVNGVRVICSELGNGDIVQIGATHNIKASIVTRDRQATLAGTYDRQRNLLTTI